MTNKTLIEWNADVGTRFLTIHPDGSFDIDKDAPPLFVIGELAKAFIRQQDRIKRLEEMYEGVIGERPELLGSNVMGLLKRELTGTQKRIKELEDRIHRAAMAFFRDGSDGHVASQMLQILEEERVQK
jgi:hypothetical protein